MKALFVYTNEAQASASHLSSVNLRLKTKYAPDYYDCEVDCGWSQNITLIHPTLSYNDINIIFIYMTNSVNSCQYLKSVIISPARQYQIKLVFIYAEDFNKSSILTGIMQIASAIIPIDKLGELTTLDNVYLDKNGNPLNKPQPIRHDC